MDSGEPSEVDALRPGLRVTVWQRLGSAMLILMALVESTFAAGRPVVFAIGFGMIGAAGLAGLLFSKWAYHTSQGAFLVGFGLLLIGDQSRHGIIVALSLAVGTLELLVNLVLWIRGSRYCV